MKWFKIKVKDEAVAKGAMKPIMDAFERVMPPGDEAKGCALFLRDEADASIIFVSPQFAAINSSIIREVHRYGGDVSSMLPYKL